MPDALFIPAALSDLSVDVSLGTPVQGSVMVRGASKWNALAPGAAGQVLTTEGAGALPAWTNAGTPATVTGDVTLSPAVSTRNVVQPAADAVTGLAIKGHSAAQSGSLQEWQDSTGVACSWFDAAGRLTVGRDFTHPGRLTVNHGGTAATDGLILNNTSSGVTANLLAWTGNTVYAPGGIVVPQIVSATTGSVVTDSALHWTFGKGVNSTWAGNAGTDSGADAFSATPAFPLAANWRGFAVYDNTGNVAALLPVWHVDLHGVLQFAAANAAPDATLYRAGPGQLKTDTGFTVGGTLTHAGTRAGFFGTAPAAQPAVAAAATDAASTQTLANSLRTALLGLGLAA